MKRFLGAVRYISQVCHEHQWADMCVRVLASQGLSKPNSRCIIYYFQWFFRPIKLHITRCHYKLYWNIETLVKLDKNCAIRFASDVWSTFFIAMLFFLFNIRHTFLDTINPMCSCGSEPETTAHFLLRYQSDVNSSKLYTI